MPRARDATTSTQPTTPCSARTTFTTAAVVVCAATAMVLAMSGTHYDVHRTRRPSTLGDRFRDFVDVSTWGAAPRAVVFWHVNNLDEIVRTQRDEIVNSSAYREGVGEGFAPLVVKYVLASEPPPTGRCSRGAKGRLGRGTLNMLAATERFVEERPPTPDDDMPCAADGHELPTLARVHAHCVQRPQDYVAYIHSKTNPVWRRALQHHVFERATECVACLAPDAGARAPRKTACGPGFHAAQPGPCPALPAPAVWCHFSGNMWWATCEWVASLAAPPFNAATLAEGTVVPSNDDGVYAFAGLQGWWGDRMPYGRCARTCAPAGLCARG